MNLPNGRVNLALLTASGIDDGSLVITSCLGVPTLPAIDSWRRGFKMDSQVDNQTKKNLELTTIYLFFLMKITSEYYAILVTSDSSEIEKIN